VVERVETRWFGVVVIAPSVRLRQGFKSRERERKSRRTCKWEEPCQGKKREKNGADK
jgi:hypothetical protein